MSPLMSRFGEVYERVRPLIIWLGLGELAWIGYWLLNFGDTTPGYMATAVVWLAVMLAWMALVVYLGNRGFFLKHTRWLSNLVGFLSVLWHSPQYCLVSRVLHGKAFCLRHLARLPCNWSHSMCFACSPSGQSSSTFKVNYPSIS